MPRQSFKYKLAFGSLIILVILLIVLVFYTDLFKLSLSSNKDAIISLLFYGSLIISLVVNQFAWSSIESDEELKIID